MRRLLTAIVLVLIVFSVAGAESVEYYHRGDVVADFALTTWDGQTVSLYEMLAAKEAVLLHFFTLRCGGCEEEMPLLRAAYEAYGDRVGFLVVTIDDADTDKKLETYCTRRNLTFPVARDTARLAYQYPVYGVPLSLVIDQEGVLRDIKEGAMDDLAAFAALVEPYLQLVDE